MNRALFKKTFLEARWLLLGCCGLVFALHWLRVWLSSLFSAGNLAAMLSFIPEPIEKLLPVPLAQVATSTGRIAVAYDDPLVLMMVVVWSLARGSDAVSGELNRGTMELLLAQPVSRLNVLTTQGVITVAGAALIACAAWFGTWTGLATVTLEQPAPASAFLPAAVNLFALGAFLAGLTTFVSACLSYRSRTIGLVGGIFAVSMILKVVGRLAPNWHWLAYLSFLSPFEPQKLVSEPARAWILWSTTAAGVIEPGGLGYDSILIGLGLVGYVGAALVFCRRDLPAPL